MRRLSFFRQCVVAITAAACLLAAVTANAVIFFRTGDPTANTTEPTGDLAGSGWQYQGFFAQFLGTTIAPHFFITARHFGPASNAFFYRGASYTVVRWFDDSGSDLRIYEVAQLLPDYAPLYSRSDEIGQHLVVLGRGTQRGDEVFSDATLRGWMWGGSDAIMRWGENQVDQIISFGALGDMLYALFDADGYAEEAHLSAGDSGGAVFLEDQGVWKLAGINYAVDGPFYTAPRSGRFTAALFDTRGFYGDDNVLITGEAPIPSGFYATRISSRLPWIRSVIGPGLVNISARALVGTRQNVCIAGFIIQGDASKTKRIVIRGIGPSLQVAGSPLAGRLTDPVLELYNATGAIILSNDNWRGSQQAAIESSGLAPSHDNEAALLAVLAPGNYTAILRGANDTTGIGLVEVYDLDGSPGTHLANLSTRADVETGSNVLIGGLIVRSAFKQVLLRGLGPKLASHGVVGELEDPVMELHDGNGALLIENDNWRDAPNSAQIDATGLAPKDDRESAILTTPAPGNYTAIIRGKENSTGIALLEAYLLTQ